MRVLVALIFFTIGIVLVAGFLPDSTSEKASNPKTTSARRATLRPSKLTLSENSIKSATRREHRGIEFRSVKVLKMTAEIEFNITPWHYSSTERIAQEVTYKVLCSIRKTHKTITRGLKFRGHLRVTDDFGKKSTALYIVLHLSNKSVNAINCQESDGWEDVNWKKVSMTYRTYRLPSNAKPDYK